MAERALRSTLSLHPAISKPPHNRVAFARGKVAPIPRPVLSFNPNTAPGSSAKRQVEITDVDRITAQDRCHAASITLSIGNKFDWSDIRESEVILKDKVALIVGGSESIGRVISVSFAEQGAATAICSRPRPRQPQIVGELCDRGLEAMWAPADMLEPAAMEGAVEQVVARYGKLDILVVSGAPVSRAANLFETTDPADYSSIVDSQFISRLNCLHASLKPMIAAGYGKVVFLATDAGRTPTPGSSIGGAATAGLMFFVRAAGRELARRGIRLNCIGVPLTAHTESWERYKSGKGLSAVHLKAYAKVEAATPFRMTVPGDLAEAALFLTGPQSDQISGAVISVNGGLSFP